MSLNNDLRGHKDLHIDVDSLTISLNYVPVVVGNQTNGIARTRDNIVTSQAEKKTEPKQEYILIPFCIIDPLISQGPKDSEEDVGIKPTDVNVSGASDKYGKDDQDTENPDKEDDVLGLYSMFQASFMDVNEDTGSDIAGYEGCQLD
ncbi:hypothetical protein Tco_1345774 [Tanacetum coccineum]